MRPDRKRCGGAVQYPLCRHCSNDASGRATLWNDIVKLIQKLETLRAVEDFDPDTVSVDIGDRKGSVLFLPIDGLNIVNAMSQLYMSVIIQ